MEIYDVIGKLIIKKACIFNKSDFEYTINLSDITKGTYLIKLTTKNGEIKIIKLIKE